MDETPGMDRWIERDYRTDRWIVAAAHAGDIRAMYCLADNVRWRPSEEYVYRHLAANNPRFTMLVNGQEYRPVFADEGDLPDWYSVVRAADAAAQRERARWSQRVAQHISPREWQEHQQWHRLRNRTINLHHQWIRPGPRDLELCRAGAGRGEVDCMSLWGEHLPSLRPDHPAEARRWQDEDEQRPPARSAALPTIMEIAVTAVITTALVPFIQAMITKAGEDSYNALREHLRNFFTRKVPPPAVPDKKDQLLVIQPSEQPQHDAVLQIWTDLPDEAITALAQLLYDMRTAESAKPRTERRWYWNGAARRWQVLEIPPDQKPGETGSS